MRVKMMKKAMAVLTGMVLTVSLAACGSQNSGGDTAKNQQENEDERNVELVSTAVDNWESYDTVFIGYPIWWYIAAWPVDGFVAANDFTGKTVIPFCTSSSSDIGVGGI